MHLNKELPMKRTNQKPIIWVPVRVELLWETYGQEKATVVLNGYTDLQDYKDGFDKIDHRAFQILYNEPEDGDDFTGIRPALQAFMNEGQTKAIALAKKMEDFIDAEEVE